MSACLLIGCGGESRTSAAPEPGLVEDSDGDGIGTADDRCPTEAEDQDGFDDEDGCPDLDNDHDGVLDTVDQCVCIREDRDGHEDEDGCPDIDNDGDDIPDPCDACPDQVGSGDDGCPAEEAGTTDTEPAPCPRDALEALERDVCQS